MNDPIELGDKRESPLAVSGGARDTEMNDVPHRLITTPNTTPNTPNTATTTSINTTNTTTTTRLNASPAATNLEDHRGSDSLDGELAPLSRPSPEGQKDGRQHATVLTILTRLQPLTASGSSPSTASGLTTPIACGSDPLSARGSATLTASGSVRGTAPALMFLSRTADPCRTVPGGGHRRSCQWARPA